MTSTKEIDNIANQLEEFGKTLNNVKCLSNDTNVVTGLYDVDQSVLEPFLEIEKIVTKLDTGCLLNDFRLKEAHNHRIGISCGILLGHITECVKLLNEISNVPMTYRHKFTSKSGTEYCTDKTLNENLKIYEYRFNTGLINVTNDINIITKFIRDEDCKLPADLLRKITQPQNTKPPDHMFM
uniref:Uncharacterized protein n=1 Tax=viral metagenome TaxID=1070528 RepID=A0A6C0CJD4_9ZZZZ